jgi:hypothetical protein
MKFRNIQDAISPCLACTKCTSNHEALEYLGARSGKVHAKELLVDLFVARVLDTEDQSVKLHAIQ